MTMADDRCLVCGKWKIDGRCVGTSKRYPDNGKPRMAMEARAIAYWSHVIAQLYVVNVERC